MVIYSGFSHSKWWFSIATLNYQRVSVDPSPKILSVIGSTLIMATFSSFSHSDICFGGETCQNWMKGKLTGNPGCARNMGFLQKCLPLNQSNDGRTTDVNKTTDSLPRCQWCGGRPCRKKPRRPSPSPNMSQWQAVWPWGNPGEWLNDHHFSSFLIAALGNPPILDIILKSPLRFLDALYISILQYHSSVSAKKW